MNKVCSTFVLVYNVLIKRGIKLGGATLFRQTFPYTKNIFIKNELFNYLANYVLDNWINELPKRILSSIKKRLSKLNRYYVPYVLVYVELIRWSVRVCYFRKVCFESFGALLRNQCNFYFFIKSKQF